MKAIIMAVGCMFLSSLLYSENNKEDHGKNKFVVSIVGRVVSDKQENAFGNQIILSASRMSDSASEENLTFIELEAISETAKKMIREIPIELPDLVYSAVQHVAKKISAVKTAKNKKEFNKSMKDYKRSLKEANDLVSLHGFQITENFFDFEKGKIKKII